MNSTEIANLDTDVPDVPEWHKNIVRERLEDYKTNKSKALDFDNAMNEIERDL